MTTLDRAKLWGWAAVILFIVWLGFAIPIAMADDCRNPHEQCGHNEGDRDDSTTATADSSSDATATGGDANSTSDAVANSSGGSSNVSTRNESTSLVLTGARDTAECFTKVTIGAEGFGIGFSRKDAYCQKVRRIAVQLERQNWEAAARLECTLRVWKEVYGKDTEQCVRDVHAGPIEEPVPTGFIAVPQEEYDNLLMAQVQQEELDEAIEQTEYRFAQQQNLIEELKEDHADDDEELERLRREVAAQKKQMEEEAARRAAVREKILEKRDAEGDSK